MTRSSSLLPIQYALVTALTGTTEGLHTHIEDRVYDYAPENATCPYIIVGSPTEVPFDAFCTMGQRVTFRLHIWSEYRGSKETKEIIQHINNVLDYAALTVTGYSSVNCYNTFSTDMRDPDNIHWHGIMDFTVYVMQS